MIKECETLMELIYKPVIKDIGNKIVKKVIIKAIRKIKKVRRKVK